MNFLYYFTNRAIELGFNITLESHHINHFNSQLAFNPNYEDIGIELRFFNKTPKEMANRHARLIIQYILKYQTVFSARFDKQDQDNQVLDGIGLYVNLIFNQSLKESDIGNIDSLSPLEHEFQIQEMKESGWRFGKFNSMTIYFFNFTEMNGSIYVKIPLRSSAILNIQDDDKYCFIWSILA